MSTFEEVLHKRDLVVLPDFGEQAHRRVNPELRVGNTQLLHASQALLAQGIVALVISLQFSHEELLVGWQCGLGYGMVSHILT